MAERDCLLAANLGFSLVKKKAVSMAAWKVDKLADSKVDNLVERMVGH